MPLTDTEEQALLDYYNGKTGHSLSVPTTVWYAIHLGAQPPDLDAGTGINEPTEANYARVSKTLGSFFAAASGADPTQAVSSEALTFATTAAAYSDDVYYICEFLTQTGTTFRRCFKLATAATVGSGDNLEVDGAKLVAELGDSGDTFGE